MSAARVLCPATSANLGPGFDALGLALGLYNAFELRPAEAPRVEATGVGCERLAGDPAENAVLRAFAATRARLGLAPLTVSLRMEVAVPPSRGLGSSATAVCAGVLAARALAGLEDDRAAALALACELEGHPDNVAPCLLGGLCVASLEEGGARALRLDVPDPPAFAVAIPRALELSTATMRGALPAQVPFADASYTAGRAALLVGALLSGDRAALARAAHDRLHQPYRGPHIPGYAAARAAALAAGALGVVISGSGPTLLAFAPDGATAAAAGAALVAAWGEHGVVADAQVLPLDRGGARVELV